MIGDTSVAAEDRGDGGARLLRLTATIFAGGVAVYFGWAPGAPRTPGVRAAGEPRQSLATARTWDLRGYHFTALATYSIRALVLSKERYWFDRGADLSPVDLVLGWGRMSDASVVDQLSISQGGRFFRWSTSGPPPIPAGEIASNCANVHLIPADATVRKRLLAVREGQVVALDGTLVSIQGDDGFEWTSSLRRDDIGGHACELMWVTSAAAER